MQDEVIRIPLWGRYGQTFFVRDYTLVDTEDAEFVNQWRWHIYDGHHGTVYAVRREGTDKHRVYLHRELLGLPQKCGEEQGDHVNRNGLDNRRANLRILTQAGNMQNTASRRGSTSKFRGVFFDRRRATWVAQARLNRHTFWLGYFATEETAANTAQDWRRANMPFATN